jgi:hypothetical protein
MNDIKKRLFEKDETLWPLPNVSSNRLGWLNLPFDPPLELEDAVKFCDSLDYSNVLLLGMGGSSLGPLVLSKIKENPKRNLTVLDTTHPKTVNETHFEDSLVIVSSKSGTTLEPNVMFSYFYDKIKDPKRFIAITDPKTPLEELALKLGFLKIFRNPADIGGRYSVLSYFGLIPAILLGYDPFALLEAAKNTDIDQAIQTGLNIGKAYQEGKDKLTFYCDLKSEIVGLWLEQLIAESTGKNSKGLIPIPTTIQESGPDRQIIPISFKDPNELGSIFYHFEIATAVAGHVLEIDPFDEPNVAESKQNTNKVLQSGNITPPSSSTPEKLPSFIEASLKPNDYVSIQAYLPYGNDNALEQLRQKILTKFNIATTKGYGPRFLHSTGQLHKGGPNSVLAIQIVDNPTNWKVPIPEKDYDFATLITAQSIGDYQSLVAHNRRIIRVQINDINELITILGG